MNDNQRLQALKTLVNYMDAILVFDETDKLAAELAEQAHIAAQPSQEAVGGKAQTFSVAEPPKVDLGELKTDEQEPGTDCNEHSVRMVTSWLLDADFVCTKCGKPFWVAQTQPNHAADSNGENQ